MNCPDERHDCVLDAGIDEKCLNENDECEGPVDWWTSGNSMKAWPRCDFHGEKRQEQANDRNSMEYWSQSDTPPSWFDPADAGETW